MIEQRIASGVELSTLLIMQWWDPDRVIFIKLVGEVDETGKLLLGFDGIDMHGIFQECFEYTSRNHQDEQFYYSDVQKNCLRQVYRE